MLLEHVASSDAGSCARYTSRITVRMKRGNRMSPTGSAGGLLRLHSGLFVEVGSTRAEIAAVIDRKSVATRRGVVQSTLKSHR